MTGRFFQAPGFPPVRVTGIIKVSPAAYYFSGEIRVLNVRGGSVRVNPDTRTADPAIMTPVVALKTTLGNQGASADRADRLPRYNKSGETTDEHVV